MWPGASPCTGWLCLYAVCRQVWPQARKAWPVAKHGYKLVKHGRKLVKHGQSSSMAQAWPVVKHGRKLGTRHPDKASRVCMPAGSFVQAHASARQPGVHASRCSPLADTCPRRSKRAPGPSPQEHGGAACSHSQLSTTAATHSRGKHGTSPMHRVHARKRRLHANGIQRDPGL